METAIQPQLSLILKIKMIKFQSTLIDLKELLPIVQELFGLTLIDYLKMMGNGSIKTLIEANTKNTLILSQYKIQTIMRERYRDNMINLCSSKEMLLVLMSEYSKTQLMELKEMLGMM